MTATTDTIIRIPLDQIHDSPSNPRRIFDDAYIAELAADIKANGLQQPVKVRPRVSPMFAGFGAEAQCGWELVFGHCRTRAARVAEQIDVPAIVCSMTDEEVKRAQISENLSRKNVHPIEEAEGFKALIDDGSETADSLAVRFGKSRSYVYGRLKLLQAIPRVRDACLRGEFGSEVLLLIARLRHPALQERALKAIEGKYLKLGDGGKKSYREIRELLAKLFTLQLKTAVFDPADALLVPGAGACTVCPKLSGNAPEFEDLAQQREGYYPGHKLAGERDLCTDPTCWEAKHKRHLQAEAYRVQRDGKTVVDGNRARASIGADGKLKGATYISVEDARRALKAAGKSVDQVRRVHIQDQKTGKWVIGVPAAEVRQLGGTPPAAEKRPSYGYTPETPEERARKEAERAARGVQASRLACAVVDAMRARDRSREDLEDLVRDALNVINSWDEARCAPLLRCWAYPTIGALRQAVQLLPVDELAVLLMAATFLTRRDWLAGWDKAAPDDVTRLVKRYGIDAGTVMATPRADELDEPADTPPPAARAQGEGDDDAGPASTPPPAARAAAEGDDRVYRIVNGSPRYAGEDLEEEPERLDGEEDEEQKDEAGFAGEGQMDEAQADACAVEA